MALKNFKSLSAQYFMGMVVVVLFAAAAFFIAEKQGEIKDKTETAQNNEPSTKASGRGIAQFLSIDEHIELLTAEDRALLKQKYLDERCYDDQFSEKPGKECLFHNWPNGDPSFSDPIMNYIPPKTKTQVKIECDPKSGKFYMNIYFPNLCPNDSNGTLRAKKVLGNNEKCGEAYFANPYIDFMNPNKHGLDVPFSRNPTNFMTSPGIWNQESMTNLTNKSKEDVDLYNLQAAVKNGGSQLLKELHVVSDRKEWKDAKLTNAVVIRGDYMIHGMIETTGYPESHGCIRLSPIDAFGLYQLIRRVGTSNVDFFFGGYGPPLKDYGGRPACSFTKQERLNMHQGLGVSPGPVAVTAAARQRTIQQSRQSRNFLENFFQRVGNFFRQHPNSGQQSHPSSQ